MWVRYSLIAMVSFSVLQLLFKQLTRMGVTSSGLLVWLFGLGTLMYAGHVVVAKEPVPVNAIVVGIIAVAAFCSYVGNYYMVKSVAVAPNPGYALAIVGVHTVVVLLGSLVLFEAELTPLKMAGVALCVAGVVLISL